MLKNKESKSAKESFEIEDFLPEENQLVKEINPRSQIDELKNAEASKDLVPVKGERIAKVIARSGVCSRREAEELISEGRVKVNGQTIETPAILITDQSIKIDNKLLAKKEPTRIWLFHKPKGLVCSTKEERGCKTIFSILPPNLPRTISVGRLDINTEGLLLLTNNGEVSRYIALPQNKWIRNYRVRAHGKINMERLHKLSKGIKIDGIKYGPIKVELEKEGTNSWFKISLHEGKNREVKKVLEYFGLTVNRLIRVSFGPFILGSLGVGQVKEVTREAIQNALPGQLL